MTKVIFLFFFQSVDNFLTESFNHPFMPDFFPQDLPISLFPFAVLFASLLGSWHCAGMCGPIACSAGLQGQSHSYHFGRLCSYCLLGLIAGGLGQSLTSEKLMPYRYTGAFMMGILLVNLGIGFFFGWSWPEKLISRFGKNFFRSLLPFLSQRKNQKFLLGFFTAFLPCGWLYSFVFIAVATKSVWLGFVTMVIFWAGTVPALMLMSAGFRRLILIPQITIRRTLGIFFIFAGIYSILSQLFFHSTH